MATLVAVGLILVLGTIYCIAYSTNQKIECEKGFTLKGYESKCKKCAVKETCGIYRKGTDD